jgi:hypothetical protein
VTTGDGSTPARSAMARIVTFCGERGKKGEGGREEERETAWQKNRETDRQTDRQTERERKRRVEGGRRETGGTSIQGERHRCHRATLQALRRALLLFRAALRLLRFAHCWGAVRDVQEERT